MSSPPVYDPYAYEIHDDPYSVYKRLRDEAPAYHNRERGFWALSRFQDIYDAMHDWQTYSSHGGVALEGSGKAPPMIIAMDPPRQVKLRRLVSSVFTPRRVAQMEPHVRALTRKHLLPLLDRGAIDFIDDFSGKLPMEVISVMLGVPESDQAKLRQWSDLLLHREPGNPSVTPAGMEAAGNLVRYFASDLHRRRQQPGDDVISGLLAAEVEGERLADDEILGFCFLLIIAGNETTTKMLGNAVYLLWKHPEQRQLLVREPRRIADAVEEVVRFDNSTQMLARVLTRDVDLHGTTMPKGDRVILLLGSGNRDERAFERADQFDVTRPAQQHLGFGFGIHVCLGASLARLEGRVALEEVLSRIPDYEIDERGMERVHSPNVRGYAHLPMRLRRS
ncbi:MAG: cytochrome P450 [Deltaproteobacteria bacterium]|nr:cytochrome P450 [Deltaproteobacteria bacterium]